MTLEKALAAFLDALSGKNRSSATLRAYRADILQWRCQLIRAELVWGQQRDESGPALDRSCS